MLMPMDTTGSSLPELIKSKRAEFTQLVEIQGGFSGIDQEVKAELAKLEALVVTNGRAMMGLPFIWGSIRILAIYGRWSWWRTPTPKPPPSEARVNLA
jgi:hypothetical protein